MELTATRHREIVRLLDEIDNELRGRCRTLRMLNLTRRIRLEIKMAKRRGNGKEAFARDRACQ